jgi:hypothetical protein
MVNDIRAFIRHELDRRTREGFLALGQHSMIDEIQDALVRGSEGMFVSTYGCDF